MRVFRAIFAVALALIFFVSTIFMLVGAGETVSVGIRTYVFQVCDSGYARPMPMPAPIPGDVNAKPQEIVQPECAIDYNNAKRQLADGLSKIVAVPFAWFSFVWLRKMMKEDWGK